jgi:non-ribosomal peptide synthetase component F
MPTFDTTPRPIAEIFAETVGKFSDKMALADSKVSLTFHELEAKLQEISKGINILRAEKNFWGYIPISVTRDVESAVLVLACHVYDIPYAPIDPDWKNERLAFVHETLGFPPFFLTTDGNSENLESQLQGLTAVRTTNALASLAEARKEEIHPPETDLGYAIFTSGTTGVPKCVGYGQRGKHEMLQNRIVLQSAKAQTALNDRLGTLSYPLFFAAGPSGGPEVLEVELS